MKPKIVSIFLVVFTQFQDSEHLFDVNFNLNLNFNFNFNQYITVGVTTQQHNQMQTSINSMRYALDSFSERTDAQFDNLNGLFEKQAKENNENYMNMLLEMKGIDGKFDSLTSQVTGLDGKIIDITFMLDDMDIKLDSIVDLVQNIDGKMDKFSDQLADLSTQISDQTLKLKVEIKFQNFFTLMSRIKRFANQRLVIIASYSTNTTGLVFYLDELIHDFRRENVEYEIVNYVDFEFVGSDSLMNSFIELASAEEGNFKSPIASSTNKMVYDFYMEILNTVNEGNAFLKLSYLMKEELTDKTFSEDALFVKINENSYLGTLLNSFQKSLDKVNTIDHKSSYVNLQRVGNADIIVKKIFVGIMSANAGYVITGVRFQVYKDILFLQIQQGELAPMGTVYQETVHWVPLPEDVSRYVEPFDEKENIFGMDKYWFEGKFLSGVQMYKNSNSLRIRVFGKEIHAQSFSLALMSPNESSKSKYSYADKPLTVDELTKGLASASNIEYHDFKISKNVSVVFGQASVGETSVPFFDTNDVSFDIKSPLAGIGLFHYTNSDKYSGFIKPYLVSLNYLSFFEIKDEAHAE